MTADPKLVQAIIEMSRTMSYGLIAERLGLTRNQIAGIMWRHKNGSAKKSGAGHHGAGVYPPYRINNTRD